MNSNNVLKLFLLFRLCSLNCRTVITKEELSNRFLVLSDCVQVQCQGEDDEMLWNNVLNLFEL